MNKEQLYTNPTKVLTAFMEAWLYQDYEKMYKLVNKAWASHHDLDFLWDQYSGIIIDDYEIIIPPPQPEKALVAAEVKIMYNGQWLKQASINLVCESKAYKASLHGDWGVNPNSTLKLIARPKTRAERRKEARKKK